MVIVPSALASTLDNFELDALVVGAGPVGLALASDLAWRGLRVRIIDKAESASTLSKAVVLMPRTLEEFAMRGMVEECLEHGQRMHSFGIHANGKLIARTEYQRLDSEYNYLLCQPQTTTERILRDRLASFNVPIEWNTELDASYHQDEEGVSLTLRKPDGSSEELRVPYLLGCDGAHSTVRHGTSIPFEGGQYKDAWMLGDVKIDWNYPHDEACSFLHHEGYLAVFPMPEGRSRIFVVRERDELLPEEVTVEALAKVTEAWTGCRVNISEPRWLAKFHVHHRKVKHYREGRVFLAGDAAHLHSPETGLGMNTGIQDAFNLAWKLALVCQGKLKEFALESYDMERNQVGKDVVQSSNAIHVLSAQFNPLMSRMRERVFRLANTFYHVHFSSVQKQVQLMINYGRSLMVESHMPHHLFKDSHDRLPGGRAPDARVLDVAKEEWTHIRHYYACRRGHLLLFTGMAPDEKAYEFVRAADELGHEYRDVFNTLIVSSSDDVSPLEGCHGTILKDVAMIAHERYSAGHACGFHIRPDGYIGLMTAATKVSILAEYYERFLEANRPSRPD